MAMLTVYSDTSGMQKSSDPLVMASLVSPVSRWLRFEREWKAMLKEHGIPYLHMKEFAHSLGPFKDWKGNEKRRAAFLARVVAVIHHSVNKTFTLRAKREDFDAVNKVFELDGPYSGIYQITALALAGHIMEWCDAKHPGKPIKWFYERGDDGLGRLVDGARKHAPHLKLRWDPIPLPAQDGATGDWFAPFQACDFVAYEVAQEWKQLDKPLGRERSRRGALRNLLRTIPVFIGEFPRENLVKVAGDIGIPRRLNVQD
jgi:hypothetical protein